jgi:hypothetical protein
MADVVEDLNTLHKEVYPDGVPDLIPNGTKVQKELKFSAKDLELGLKYVQPVRLAYPSGFTHAAGDGTAGAFSLNDSKAGTQKRAEVTGSQILLRDQLAYEDAAKASKGGKKSFVEATSYFYEGMQKAMRKRIETELLYGASGLGTVSSYSNPTITLSAATFAPGIWSGLEGCEVEVMNGGSSRGTATISSVDIDARTVTLSADVSGTTANDVVYFKGAYGNEMSGIHKILTNTGSLFNISASTYSLWKATSHSASSAALSFSILKKAVAKAVGKGLDEDAILLVNPKGWDDLMSDIAALRRTDKSEVAKVEIGAEELVYHSQNGMLRVIPSIFVKEGNAYGMCVPYWKRMGAADVSFNMPAFGGDMFFHLQSKAGVEARCYTHQAIFCEAPAKNFVITSIVNS